MKDSYLRGRGLRVELMAQLGGRLARVGAICTVND